MAKAARAAGVQQIAAAAFEGETDPKLAEVVDEIEWMRVGQLGRMIKTFSSRGIRHAVMAGQIAPGNLFSLRPDLKAFMVLARLKERNAETIFGAIGDELAKAGVELLLATTFMEQHLAGSGVFAGPKLSRKEQNDVQFGFKIAKDVSRLDIGQTVVVKGGTVLAVEGFDGTNATIRRGGELGKGGAVVVKVSKPNQDLRFDVPVVGPATLETAGEAHIRVIAVEAGRTLIMERARVEEMASRLKISLFGVELTFNS
jgi:UDP-2,3-diacylglucosamine hydrolase